MQIIIIFIKIFSPYRWLLKVNTLAFVLIPPVWLSTKRVRINLLENLLRFYKNKYLVYVGREYTLLQVLEEIIFNHGMKYISGKGCRSWTPCLLKFKLESKTYSNAKAMRTL